MTPVFTFYYREGCHLCDDMLRELQLLSFADTLTVQQVDIDQDDKLRTRFNTDVPVLSLGDEIICKYYLDESRVREALSHV